MKNTFLITGKRYLLLTGWLIVLIPVITLGQLPLKKVHETVEYTQILKNWKLNETKEFEGVKILRMEGEKGIDHRTNLLYLSSFCKYDSLYGKLVVFNDRNDEALADPSLLTVRILDAKGDKVYLERTLSGDPHYYRQGIWYNYIEMEIPENVNKQFVVQISDKGLNKDFVFFVFGLPEFCYALE